MYRIVIVLFVGFLMSVSGNAQSLWPQKVLADNGVIISIYEPQPENFSANNITARAAVSIRIKDGAEPNFGVMWFDAELSPATGDNIAVKSVTVTKSKFADDDKQSVSILKSVLEKKVPAMNIQLNKSRLNEMLSQLKMDEGDGIENTPPTIYYRKKPTTLIVLDGEPIEQQDADLKMVRVMNSPYLIVQNPDNKRYYLYGGDFWYSSTQVKTGWSHVKTLPAKIKTLDAAIKEKEKENAGKKDEITSPKLSVPTDILISTKPAELIQSEGDPSFRAVENSTLLYVDNSLDEIFKDVESQKNYVLLSGRWYRSSNMEGPWEFVGSESLPASFATIPSGSEKDGVLASVAGTDAAEEAIVAAYVPQTAKVDRTSITCTVSYDGEPKFESIPNTNLMLAENANLTVMLAPNNQYYALENGIWFKSNSANGPWEVANERPSDVEKIQPGSPAYNTKYVYIYETTPQYVYVGYTPGYMGCYRYHHTVVWGTGWHYHPWYRHRYYPRPYTWGFGMHYNPWNGWTISFGLSFNYGWYHYHPGGGWFGPPMYYPPYRPWGWNGGYYSTNNRPPSRPPHRPNVTTNRPGNLASRPAIAARPAIQPNLYQNRKAILTEDKIQRPIVRPSSPTKPAVTRPTAKPSNPIAKPAPTRPSVKPAPKPSQPSVRPNAPVVRPTPAKPTMPATRPTPKMKSSVVKPVKTTNKASIREKRIN